MQDNLNATDQKPRRRTAPRTPLRERALPDYTRGEERANMVTHIVGGGLGAVILVLAVLISILHRSPWGVVSGSVYGGSMVCLFTVSSVYHGMPLCCGKLVMQIIDHCSIYLLIAGTYTPILLSALRPEHPALAWTLFGVEWGLAAAAAVFTAIDLRKYRRLSMICYVGMGWCILLALKPTWEALGAAGFLLLLAGGLVYTAGAVLYAKGKKNPRLHTVFHLFTDAASLLQAAAILGFAL